MKRTNRRRSTRNRHHTKRIIDKRMKIVQDEWGSYWMPVSPHVFHKWNLTCDCGHHKMEKEWEKYKRCKNKKSTREYLEDR